MFMELKLQKFDYLDRMRASELYRKKNPRVMNTNYDPVRRCQYKQDLEYMLEEQNDIVEILNQRFPPSSSYSFKRNHDGHPLYDDR